MSDEWHYIHTVGFHGTKDILKCCGKSGPAGHQRKLPAVKIGIVKTDFSNKQTDEDNTSTVLG